MTTALQRIEAEYAVSVSELKKSPSAVIEEAKGAVAVLNHNRVMAYLIPAEAYEAMLERLDDMALIEIIKARANEIGVPVTLDEL